MNFISTFDELNKLYEEAPTQKAVKRYTEGLEQTTPTVQVHSKEEASKIINADKKLSDEYNELLPYYEEGTLDHSFEYGNFFNQMGDESKVVIQWVKSETESTEIIVDSLEAAIVVVRDITSANGNVSGTSTYVAEKLVKSTSAKSLKEDADEEEIEIVDDEPKQTILECSKCGALVIVDEVVVDEESDLVNVEDACKFCEEKEGYKIVGSVVPYEAAEAVEEAEQVEDVADGEEESEVVEDEFIEEDLADLYRKTFDKPASVAAQQSWEDELSGATGEISPDRRRHLERKFAQQRDW